MKAQLIEVGTQNKETRLTWYCPGCKCDHGVPVPPHPKAWGWNGSTDAPTLTPSVLITYGDIGGGLPKDRPAVCHCFVRDGRIEFCGDSTHPLAGQTVEMADLD